MRWLLGGRPQHYQGFISARRFVVKRCGRVDASKFQDPATNDGQKLYAVRARGKLVYVGITREMMSARLRLGLKPAKGQSKYRYKWRCLKGRLHLFVWVMQPVKGRAAKKCDEQHAEAVEAEVAGLHRHLTGKWPKYQNEVHFRNKPGAAELAAKLYAEMVE